MEKPTYMNIGGCVYDQALAFGGIGACAATGVAALCNFVYLAAA